jgi:hypothetical protein
MLPPGHYWLAVQANMNFVCCGQWGWTDRTVLSSSPAMWQNPGNGFGTGCTTWGTKAGCGVQLSGPDQVFRLRGTSGPTITNTPTHTPTPARLLIGHVTWQGITQPDARNTGITATLTLCVGGAPQNQSVTTDAAGVFTVTTSLPAGSYNYRIKGIKWLASAGILSLATGDTWAEFGTMRAGDANNDDAVTVLDFNVLRGTFAMSQGYPGYDGRADFNRDNMVNVLDFNLWKVNFGTSGAAFTCP